MRKRIALGVLLVGLVLIVGRLFDSGQQMAHVTLSYPLPALDVSELEVDILRSDGELVAHFRKAAPGAGAQQVTRLRPGAYVAEVRLRVSGEVVSASRRFDAVDGAEIAIDLRALALPAKPDHPAP